MSRPRLVLLGPGLANLQAMTSLAGAADLSLISEGTRHTYSGMLPGVLAGQHSAHSATIDLQALAARVGATLFAAGARRVDPAASVVELNDGVRVPYDFLSINMGAGLRGDALPGIREEATLTREFKPPVQPLQLMNLGDGRALGTWKGRVFRGRAEMLFKEWTDRRWISQYPVTSS